MATPGDVPHDTPHPEPVPVAVAPPLPLAAVEIDGSLGEGGGQVLRSALSLSAVTGRPLVLTRIRAGRPRGGGLQAQHLCCVRAAAATCGAALTGVVIGSTSLTFRPSHPPRGGNYSFSVGTAGSASLVAQTLIPILLTTTGASSSVDIEGGTHNPWAPPAEALRDAYAGTLAKTGAQVGVTVVRHGFAPAGGGCLRVTVTPAAPYIPLSLHTRGALVSRKMVALVGGSVPDRIGAQLGAAAAVAAGWPSDTVVVTRVACAGGGCNLIATLVYDRVTVVLSGVVNGRGRADDPVSVEVGGEVAAYESAGDASPVDAQLGDQLLLPLALGGGGGFGLAGAPSSHFTTNVTVLEAFLGAGVVQVEGGNVVVRGNSSTTN